MCEEAGIFEHKTNHSLRATGASVMFNAVVPDKLICDITGHRSTALQLYECPTVQQKQAVSKVLVQCTQNFIKTKLDKENSCNTLTENPTPGFTFSTLSNCNINIGSGQLGNCWSR